MHSQFGFYLETAQGLFAKRIQDEQKGVGVDTQLHGSLRSDPAPAPDQLRATDQVMTLRSSSWNDSTDRAVGELMVTHRTLGGAPRSCMGLTRGNNEAVC